MRPPAADSSSRDRSRSCSPARSGSCSVSSFRRRLVRQREGFMRRGMVLAGLIAAGALSMHVAAYQQPAANAPKVVTADKIKDNLWVLKGDGGGGNTAVFVVDAKNPGWGQPILDKIKELTTKPVAVLINTHTHGDHVSGNVEFPATVEVVTQENTKINMEKMPIFKEHNGRGLPKRTFKDKMTIGS